jgi:hypothetical protein
MIARITPTIMDGIVVRWTPTADGPHEISASRNGVSVTGWIVVRAAVERVRDTCGLP